MPITAEQLEGLTSGLYAEAEKHFQANGTVVPALWFISEGAARLVAMPKGVIDREQTAEIARTDRPSAIVLTGESWLGSVTVPASTAAQLHIDDLPRPSEQPDRREVIATRGIGRGPDGSLLHTARTNLSLCSLLAPQAGPCPTAPAGGDPGEPHRPHRRVRTRRLARRDRGGLRVNLAGAEDKRAQIDARKARNKVNLPISTVRSRR